MIYATPEAIQDVRAEARCTWAEAKEIVERRKVDQSILDMYGSGVDQRVIDVLEWLVARVN